MLQKKSVWLSILLLSLSLAPARAEEQQESPQLFPVVDPFFTGNLRVSERHTIHFMLFGNPTGKPVFVLHGGPGFGCYPRLTQYFDPGKYFIILHDQRGSGKSVPLGEVMENTTAHLVADIEALRRYLLDLFEIDGKIMIFGGSWGTTLGLAYAETHPDKVSCMVLRGVFLGTPAEIDNFWGGRSTRCFFPQFRAELEAALPDGCDPFTPGAMKKILDSRDQALKKKVLAAWCRYSVKIGRLHTPDEYVNQPFGGMDILPCARIDAHYMANLCFLEKDQLIRDAHKIKNIPTTIINGRYDMICPPLSAFRLHKQLKRSKLILVEEAGHSEGEEGTTAALLKAVAEFASSS